MIVAILLATTDAGAPLIPIGIIGANNNGVTGGTFGPPVPGIDDATTANCKNAACNNGNAPAGGNLGPIVATNADLAPARLPPAIGNNAC
jgi:hypothetical protein